jgi:uncharacterized protein (TIGR03067 family)
MKCIVTFLLLGVPLVAQETKSDLDKLQGHWRMVESTRDGKKTPGEVKIERTIESNNYTVTVKSDEGEQVLSGTLKIDPAKNPKTIDATRTEGPDAGQAMLGIYEIEGNRQKVCFAPPGKTRPTEFASKPGTGHVLTIWQKAPNR